MKSSRSIWHYVVSVKSRVKILSIFVAFLENTNFKEIDSLPTQNNLELLKLNTQMDINYKG